MSYNQLITDYKQFSESQTHRWFVKIFDALNYLHENLISHLDIKPNNILFIKNENNVNPYLFKLTDFGLSQKF